MTSKSNEDIQKTDIIRTVLSQGSLGMEFSWNYERQIHITFTTMMNKISKKVYAGDKEGYGDALTRHIGFSNITPQLAPLVGGIVASMKEIKPRSEVGGGTISSTKTVLMGPLGGIGNSVFIGYPRMIAIGIDISLTQNGNMFEPIVYSPMYNIPAFTVRCFDAHFSYNIGFKYLQRMQVNGTVGKLLVAASILSVMVIGCMSKGMVRTALNVELSKAGEEVTTLQSILDGIMLGLIGLDDTRMYFRLLKKKANPIISILGTMVLGVVGTYFGIFAG